MNKETIEKEIAKYRMTFDYHTHTVFSHGKGTIEDNVREAVRKGLDEIAIADHGPGHQVFGVKHRDFPVMRTEVNRLRRKYPNIKIWLSVEANVLDGGGKPEKYIDLIPEDLPYLDFVLTGYHFGTRHAHMLENFLHYTAFPGRRGRGGDAEEGPSAMSAVSVPVARAHLSETKLMVKNTDMVVQCLYENEIKILTHPGDKGPFDIPEIARACAERGTWMEINRKHPYLGIAEIKEAARFDVRFVLSSDAHRVEDVGCYREALIRAFAAGLDPARIVNIASVAEEKADDPKTEV